MDRSETRGNVVFVVLDTTRKDHLSAYGYDRPTTPGLEAFAEEATRFEQAVAPAPWTLPVHASMFTGLYPSEHGATQESPYLDGSTTLAETLSAAGYGTACYSSNAWITPYTNLTAGFQESRNFFEVLPSDLLSGPLAGLWKRVNDNERLRAVADRLVGIGNTFHEYFASQGSETKTPSVIDSTIEFIDGTGDPYFAFINLMDPHLPYYPAEQFREEFAPGVDPAEVCQNSKEFNCGARAIDGAEWEDITGLYDAEIRQADAAVTRLFDWLRANGEWEDTLVVVCADHGELHGEHDLFGHEFAVYDPLVNVPLLVKHPDMEPGVADEQVELIDLYHTVLDHTGVTAAGAPLDPSRSLLSAERGHEYAFVEYHRPVVELTQLESKAESADITLEEDSRFYSRMRSARRPDAQYIENERIPDEFYRLGGDGEDEAIEEACRSALAAFEERVGATWSTGSGDAEAVLDGMDEETQEQLRHLGYVE